MQHQLLICFKDGMSSQENKVGNNPCSLNDLLAPFQHRPHDRTRGGWYEYSRSLGSHCALSASPSQAIRRAYSCQSKKPLKRRYESNSSFQRFFLDYPDSSIFPHRAMRNNKAKTCQRIYLSNTVASLQEGSLLYSKTNRWQRAIIMRVFFLFFFLVDHLVLSSLIHSEGIQTQEKGKWNNPCGLEWFPSVPFQNRADGIASGGSMSIH